MLLRVLSVCWMCTVGLAQQSAGSDSERPVALIDGRPVLQRELLPLVGPQLLELRNREFELRSAALETVLGRKLLDAEAAKLGMNADDLLRQEADSKVEEPTDGEVYAYFLAQRDRANQPYQSASRQLRQALKDAKIQQARQDYVKRLRSQAKVEITLPKPRWAVMGGATRFRGEANAPVTIVEFSDFQCSFCRRSVETMNGLLEKYKGRVRLAFRDFPLDQMHPAARLAAEAGRCAADQGRFWEFHDLLFANQTKLAKEDLLAHGGKLGIDTAIFEACVSGRKHSAAIEADIKQARDLGLNGTPAFFVNGVFVNGAQASTVFEKLIDEELTSAH